MKKVRHGLKKFRGTLSPHTSFERSQNQQPSSRATSPTLAAVSSSISTQASQSSPAQENIGTSTSLADWWKTHRSGIISSVEKVFKVTAKVLELVPLAEPAVKAFETAGEVLEEVQRMWENVDTIRDLTREMDHLLRAIARCEQSGPLSQAMQARIAALKAELAEHADAWHKHATKSTIIRLINAEKIEQGLTDLRNQVKESISRFMLESQLAVEPAIDSVNRSINALVPVVNQLYKQQITNAENALLDRLNPVKSAWLMPDGSLPGCLPGTRAKLLEDIMVWLHSDDDPPVFWLRGLAGTGKTAIARTVANLAAAQALSAGCFFFSRADVSRQRPGAVIPSLAYQLAKWRPALRRVICAAIESDTDIASRTMQEQVNNLFSDALAHVSSPVPRALLLIDGLDECEKVGDCEGGALLPYLISSLHHLPFRVKLFLTSRDEHSIRRMFQTAQASRATRTLALHVDIENNIVDGDIAKYLRHEFAGIADATGDNSFPPPGSVDELVTRARGLFIYAVTLTQYVRTGCAVDSPSVLLRDVLSRRADEAEYHYRQLDDLYLQVLSNGGNPDRIRSRVRDMIASLVLVREPMSPNVFANLTGLPQNAVGLLSSLLLESSDGTVRPFHPSLADFLVDSGRCRDPAFVVVPDEHHARLARQCLLVMNRHLCYDIAGICNPNRANADVDNLYVRIEQKVPQELRYASRYWVAHLTRATVADQPLLSELQTFCENHLLHWLELSSLLGQLPLVDANLPTALLWCQTHEHVQVLRSVRALLHDVQRTLQVYRAPVTSHALHVYHSALVTMPQCALLQHASIQCHGVPRMISARPAHWNLEYKVLEYGKDYDAGKCVVFSPDGRRVMSGTSEPHAPIRIWDAHTGAQTAVLLGHEGQVASVAFSLDGRHIFTADNRTFRAWDADTGESRLVVKPPHDTPVAAIFASPNGKHVVTILSDHSAYVWDTHTAEGIALLRDVNFSKRIAYSPDGVLLAAVHSDKGRYVYNRLSTWDTRLYHCRALIRGHEAEITGFAFSPDGKQLASVSWDHTVRIWDANTGDQEVLLVQRNTGYGTCVAFSHTGQQLVFGWSPGGNVQIWDVPSCTEITSLDGVDAGLECVAFSPNDRQIAGCSTDGKLWLWDAPSDRMSSIAASSRDKERIFAWFAQSSRDMMFPDGHGVRVKAILFSQDGKYVLSAAEKRWPLLAWDTQTGQRQIFEPLWADGDVAEDRWSILFSSDSDIVVFMAGAVHIWETPSGRYSQLRCIVCPEGRARQRDLVAVQCVAISADKSHIALVKLEDLQFRWWRNANQTTIHIYDARTGSLKSTAVYQHDIDTEPYYHDDIAVVSEIAVSHMALSHDGARLVSAASDSTMRVWDTHTGAQLATIRFPDIFELSASSGFHFSDDQKQVRFHYFATQQHHTWEWHWQREGAAFEGEHDVRALIKLLRTGKKRGDVSMEVSSNGWVIHRDISAGTPEVALCWLPMDRRGRVQFSSLQSPVFAVGADSGAVTILDFTDTLAMLDLPPPNMVSHVPNID